ncbi:MAG: hypothetical protein JNK65_01500, partial [Deltaproteobacteria bacterium]|nr:hypothetical protein [Deltaproteobacteria bacterium]
MKNKASSKNISGMSLAFDNQHHSLNGGSMNNIVQVKEVIKDYLLGKVKVPALRKLNLDVKTGEFLCIMGPSGS